MREEYLVHHGVKGMHWGIRRYQNEDGSRTAAGKKRYGNDSNEKRKMSTREKIHKASKIAAVIAGAYTGNQVGKLYRLNKSVQNRHESIRRMGELYKRRKQFAQTAAYRKELAKFAYKRIAK